MTHPLPLLRLWNVVAVCGVVLGQLDLVAFGSTFTSAAAMEWRRRRSEWCGRQTDVKWMQKVDAVG
jgi:hypothetical protein